METGTVVKEGHKKEDIEKSWACLFVPMISNDLGIPVQDRDGDMNRRSRVPDLCPGIVPLIFFGAE